MKECFGIDDDFLMVDFFSKLPRAVPRSQEQRNNDELIDLFADAMKARLRSGEIKFSENNWWLKHPEYCDFDEEIVDSWNRGNYMDMVVYVAYDWYHKGKDL